jgi:hypothetical protein
VSTANAPCAVWRPQRRRTVCASKAAWKFWRWRGSPFPPPPPEELAGAGGADAEKSTTAPADEDNEDEEEAGDEGNPVWVEGVYKIKDAWKNSRFLPKNSHTNAWKNCRFLNFSSIFCGFLLLKMVVFEEEKF